MCGPDFVSVHAQGGAERQEGMHVEYCVNTEVDGVKRVQCVVDADAVGFNAFVVGANLMIVAFGRVDVTRMA